MAAEIPSADFAHHVGERTEEAHDLTFSLVLVYFEVVGAGVIVEQELCGGRETVIFVDSSCEIKTTTTSEQHLFTCSIFIFRFPGIKNSCFVEDFWIFLAFYQSSFFLVWNRANA